MSSVLGATSSTGQRKNKTEGDGYVVSNAEWKEENDGMEYAKLERKKQLAKLQAAFRKIDTDGSGTIDVQELWQLVKESFPDHSEKVQQSFYETILREVDVDGDGNLSYLEFAGSDEGDRMMRLIELAESTKRVEAAFAKIDRDGSGLIDHNELRELLKMCFPRAKEDTLQQYYSAILVECDKDRSGTISMEEFLGSSYMDTIARALMSDDDKNSRAKEGVLQYFVALDKDGSGKIDTPELEELLKKCFPVAGRDQRDKYLAAILSDCDKEHTGSIAFTDFVDSQYIEVLAAGLYEDLERTEKAVVKKRKTRNIARKKRVLRGGMAARCSATSPRRAEKPDVYAAAKTSERLDKLKNRLPGVPRYEADNFKPQGLTGDFLLQKAEDTVEDAPAVSNQWADAQELFEDAAEAYEKETNYLAAGEAYIRSADCFGKLGRPIESAQAMVKASEQYRKVAPQEAIDSLNEAIEIYEDHDRMRQVARIHRTIGEILEELGEFDDSIEYFEEAAELYDEDGNLPTRVYCLRMVARMQVKAGYFEKAVKMYEHLADITMKDNISGNPQLGRLEVRDFYLRAVLCLLAMADNTHGIDRLAGIERAQTAFRKYTDIDIEGFNQGQEYFLAKKMVDLSLKQDAPGMKQTIADYEKWTTSRAADGIRTEGWVLELMGRIYDSLLEWLDRAGQGHT